MRWSWHDIWGCARGPVARLAPHVRIAAGAGVFAACLVAPATRASGTALIAAAAAAWIAACRPPRRIVAQCLLLGLVLFLPYFLLIPLVDAEVAPAWGKYGALAVPWSVFLHGLASLAVSVAAVTSLGMSELREGLGRLPIPRVVVLIVVQIVQQSTTLLEETQRAAAAMLLRGAAGKGFSAMRVLASFPRVWLPRVIARAERVAVAMELRGYCEAGSLSFTRAAFKAADGAALALAALAFGGALALRWVQAP
ncbi:MAG TPA: CbiQ family ECF transporter T component [Planctomycetota bacterium]|jgi:energy-coupling factor transporter transmembrane protein EcfT|nr:hypothetical protein [Planctomycetota bacterium]OQC19181.1 MAG: Cobalt transport protein [Planctomycetes bacterium ADurb.Bin069]HNS00360.1 CbiQ family ECF transporter T component [Planctomycetota bacterium]HOE30955.1 CbiQ family ECF transporter T component [Planctomycetota bacterium]HOE88349.1 CbiQ family ECF transporter T component [Planctomycetota bacterium]